MNREEHGGISLADRNAGKPGFAVCRIVSKEGRTGIEVLIEEELHLKFGCDFVRGRENVLLLTSPREDSVSWIVMEEEGIIELMEEIEVAEGQNELILPAPATAEEGVYYIAFLTRGVSAPDITRN